jgi:hypothetical protein
MQSATAARICAAFLGSETLEPRLSNWMVSCVGGGGARGVCQSQGAGGAGVISRGGVASTGYRRPLVTPHPAPSVAGFRVANSRGTHPDDVLSGGSWGEGVRGCQQTGLSTQQSSRLVWACLWPGRLRHTTHTRTCGPRGSPPRASITRARAKVTRAIWKNRRWQELMRGESCFERQEVTLTPVLRGCGTDRHAGRRPPSPCGFQLSCTFYWRFTEGTVFRQQK